MQNLQHKNSTMSDEEIIRRATALAEDRSTLGELFGVEPQELYGTASLALLLAAHGNMSEAHTLMDGLLALSPRDGMLYTIFAEICHLEGDRESVKTLLDGSTIYEGNGERERIRRAELAYWCQERNLCERELAELSTMPVDPQVTNRLDKLQKRMNSVNRG